MKKLYIFLAAEAGQVASILFCLGIIFYIYGCESKVMSLNGPHLVSRAILQLELDTYLRTAEIRFAQLDRKDAFKQALFNQALITTQTGTINPYGVIISLLGALGIGATVDNVRKRSALRNNARASNAETDKKP